ncbi:hypothetical protein QEJ31_02215 [Pigmentibacter sp. JX0631]|uniref:hypothetical protein n=1 Tax=Pigmentibacter sp. JX0631 TaxID=2976982 RepID=UPI0024690E31|nr:hypothetical protein [Pigmentibacter sp. JX0631]WGL60419.1 hypothetical protein QEJ31_02215 [Pigmentibacter sp. JX0631]
MKIFNVLIFFISFILITSCGIENSRNDSSKDKPDNNNKIDGIGNIVDVGNQETQIPGDELVTNIQIPAEGSDQKIDVVVKRKKNTAIVEIKSFPAIYTGQMKIISDSLFSPTQDNCNKIRDFANLKMIQFVRENESSSIKFISRVDFLSNKFITKILSNVEREINISRKNITFTNHLNFENISYSIDFDSDAISNILGNTKTLSSGLSILIYKELILSGSMELKTSYKDLICDLYFKKAHLKIVYNGTFDNNRIYNVVENFDENIL